MTAGESPRADPHAAFDHEHLVELRGLLGSRALASLVEMMVGDIPARVAAIRAALRASQPRVAADQAHALRGAASGLGARALAEACRAVERLGPADPLPAHFAAVAETTCAGLRHLLDQLSTSSD